MGREPVDVASHLNARLNADTGIEEYFTLAYGTADLRTGLVRLVQAGHPHPMLLRQTGEVEFIGGGGVPVGLLPDVRFEQMEFRMQPGDRLLLYSDGLTECQVDQGEMLEEAGLVDMLQSSTHIAGREMLDDVFWRLTERMTPETGMSDDVSALLFEYQGPDSNR